MVTGVLIPVMNCLPAIRGAFEECYVAASWSKAKLHVNVINNPSHDQGRWCPGADVQDLAGGPFASRGASLRVH